MTTTTIKIEMIHDVVCSWCPIGYNNIKAALFQLDDPVDVDFRFLPYELNPDMPRQGETIEAHLKRRNNWTTPQLLEYRKNLLEVARQAGLDYDFSKRTHYWNTAKAHKLIHFAEKFDRHEEVNRALTEQYFTKGLNVDNEENLAEVASSVGLDREDVLIAFTSPQIATEMQAKHARVRNVEPRSVPAFIVNDSELVSGSNSVEFFIEYFSNLLAKSAA